MISKVLPNTNYAEWSTGPFTEKADLSNAIVMKRDIPRVTGYRPLTQSEFNKIVPNYIQGMLSLRAAGEDYDKPEEIF